MGAQKTASGWRVVERGVKLRRAVAKGARRGVQPLMVVGRVVARDVRTPTVVKVVARDVRIPTVARDVARDVRTPTVVRDVGRVAKVGGVRVVAVRAVAVRLGVVHQVL